MSERFCLPDDGHSCDTCLWHYDDVWHNTECPRCCHAPEHVAAPLSTPTIDDDGRPCTCTEMGPRPCHWWPRVMSDTNELERATSPATPEELAHTRRAYGGGGQ